MKREHTRQALRPHTRRRRSTVAGAVSSVALGIVASIASAQVTTPPSIGDRVLGLDISAWQGNISQTTWNNIRNVENRQFVFLRSSRGGTTGYYNQSNAGNDNPPGQNTLSQRYDDPYFVQNINRATAAGMLAGPYHFGRMDIIASTLNSNGIPNDGTDEANHFIQMAGAWMRPGYLLPVFDFEAGSGQRTPEELAQFAIDFSDRIYAVKGIRPAVYIGNNYANPMNSIPSSAAVVSAFPTLWTARWPNQTDPNSIPVQTTDPADYTSTVYGPWDNPPNPADPWKIWQYASTGRLTSFNNGNSNLDMDVAHGNIEYMKDLKVPALWISASDGNWTTLANWNSGETPVLPVTGPGQVAPVGTQTLPTVRLPGAQDNVDLNRPGENVTVTLSSGAQSVRRINLNERLNVTGGSLDASLTGQVGAGGTLSISGGSVTFTQGYVNNGGVLDFSGPGTLNVGTLFLNGNPTFSGASGTGQILPKAGVASWLLDLGAGTRTFTVGEGAASIDMRIAIPLANGNLTKDGAGTLELTANNTAYAGTLNIANGYLLVTANNQLGTAGVRTSQTSQSVGGSVRLSGSGLNIAAPITLGGLGASNGGALENFAGNNTWSGPVLLAGLQNNQNEPGLNQIAAAVGTTLTLSGVMQNNTTAASWAKIGAGDVVLTGASPNTYTQLTRLFGGRLIIEKNGALGAAGATNAAAGNTFQLGSGASTLAFRATGSGFDYSTFEVINTDGTGAPGYGQVDNLGGTNTFAGQIAFAGTPGIGVTAGSLEIQGGLYARGTTGTRTIAKTGAGTLILSGASAGAATGNASVVPLTGSTINVNAGIVELRGATPQTNLLPGVTTWNVNAGATLKNTAGSVEGTAIDVAAGGSLLFNGGAMNLTSLTLSGGNAIVAPGGSKVLRTNALSITAGGTADLGDNDLIVDYAGPSPLGSWSGSAYTGVTGLIQSGRNGGGWGGNGIVTSQTDATAGSMTSLGIAEAGDVLSIAATETAVWNGQSVDGAAALVMYTYGGDANLDGKINVDDYGRIDNHIAMGSSGWYNGDFNYDGKINVDDYGIIDFNIGAQGAPLAATAPVASLSEVAAVPEPGQIILVAGASLLLRRRERKAPRRLARG